MAFAAAVSSAWRDVLYRNRVHPQRGEHIIGRLLSAHQGRDYHNLQHLTEMLAFMRCFCASAIPDSMVLACLFHDVVYDSQRHDNERQSAALARGVLTSLQLPRPVVNECCDLITATEKHQPRTPNWRSHLFLDADLSILAAASDRYRQYARAVRCEYAWVSNADYQNGRAAVLEKFLSRERIYFTPLVERTMGGKARANLRAELEELKGQMG